MITAKQAYQIIECGSYIRIPNNIDIKCDLCCKHYLEMSINYGQFNLCILCTQSLVSNADENHLSKNNDYLQSIIQPIMLNNNDKIGVINKYSYNVNPLINKKKDINKKKNKCIIL